VNATVFMAVRDEPVDRIERAVSALTRQEGCDSIDVIVAAPAADRAPLACLRPSGAVTSIALVHNPNGGRSAGLNLAVVAARTPFVVRVDARSIVPPDYVARSVRRLASDATIGVVGAVQRPHASDGAARTRGIARALRNPWLLGGARYRRSGSGGVVDTVYLGAFRRDELLALGGYDEALVANEDYDLCARYRRAGRTVWLEPGLEVAYEPRATYRELWRQYRSFGASKARYWYRTGMRPAPRQAIALAGIVCGATYAGWSARHPARIATLIGAGAAALAICDHVVDPAERDPGVRAHAVAASACVVGAWACGVLSGAAAIRRSGDVEHALERDTSPLGGAGVDRDLVDEFATVE
jgi:GT2 family glycosyltransferase